LKPTQPETASWHSRLYWTAFTLADIAANRRFPYLAPARLAALQNERVRRIVEHAYASVPFYREALDQRGLRPHDFRTAADLERLPIVTGAEFARDPLRFRSTALAGEPVLETSTSGTTGHAKRIAWDRAAVFRARAAGIHQRRVLGELLGTMRKYRILSVQRAGGTRADVSAFHRAHSWLPERIDPDRREIHPDDDFERSRELINRIEPDVIGGFGSYVGAIYRWAHERRLAIHVPKLVLYGGEHLPAADAALLTNTFGVRVRTFYQACEAFRIAYECAAGGGLHIYVNQVALRIADAEGKTLPAGERGNIVLSNLTNRATVLLNYAIGDFGSMATAQCACGRTLPMLASLDGRADDLVQLPGGEVAHDSVLLSALYVVPGVIRLQLIQEALDRFTIRVMHSAALHDTSLRERLGGALEGALGRRVQVSVEISDDLRADASGKFRTVISHLSPKHTA
jgi:phenylacetate-CoA ligase